MSWHLAHTTVPRLVAPRYNDLRRKDVLGNIAWHLSGYIELWRLYSMAKSIRPPIVIRLASRGRVKGGYAKLCRFLTFEVMKMHRWMRSVRSRKILGGKKLT